VEADEFAPKTVSNRHSANSRFYTTVDRLDLLPSDERNPTDRVERGNVPGLSKKTVAEMTDGESFHYLEPDQIDELIDNVPAPKMRNEAIVMLMANTGLRASEVMRARLNKLDLENRELTVLCPKKSDDNENDPVYITVYWRSPAVSRVLDGFIEFERPSYAYADESPYVFPSKQSERIGYDQVNRTVKEAAEEAGLQESQSVDAAGQQRQQVTSHVLRHSYAMAALDNGMSIDEIRDQLHHTDISVTMKYLRRHEEDRRLAVERHGPEFGH